MTGYVEEGLREQARERVKKRREFWPHLLVYVMVNAFVVVVWFMTDGGGFFWPIFLMVAWGIGLVMHAWDAFFRTEITEQDVDREVARMQHR
jgi:2TM domain